MATKENDECRETADRENLIRFTLHSKDLTAPAAIAEWIKLNILTAPDEKLISALECALEMRCNPDKRMPD